MMGEGTQKIWAVPGYAHAPFSPKFLRAFVRTDTANIPSTFEVRSFTRPEIIGVLKIGQSLGSGYAHASFSPKFLMGFSSD